MVNNNITSRGVSEKVSPINRRVILWILMPVLLWFLAAPVQAQEDNTVLILGDSISSAYGLAIEDGWVAQLEDRLSDENIDSKVVNASVTGDTSGNGLGRLPALLDEYQPRMVIIELGGNDGLRGLSIKKLQANLVSMAFSNAATQTDALLVPSLFEGLSASAEWFQSDGIHPSAKAQPLMLDNVWKIIEPALEEALAQ